MSGSRLLITLGLGGLLTAVVLRVQTGPARKRGEYSQSVMEQGWGLAIAGAVLVVAGLIVWLL